MKNLSQPSPSLIKIKELRAKINKERSLVERLKLEGKITILHEKYLLGK